MGRAALSRSALASGIAARTLPDHSLSRPRERDELEAERLAPTLQCWMRGAFPTRKGDRRDPVAGERIARSEHGRGASRSGSVGSDGSPRRSPAGNVVADGTPLPPAFRARAEAGLGRDLGHVRVHTDGAAGDLSEMLGARALTVGSHILFSKGAWQPTSPDGEKLIAHELVHVAQQTQSEEQDGALPVRERVAHRIQGNWLTDTWDRVKSSRASQFASDIGASILEVPQHAGTVLGQVWDSIREHWVAFSVVLLGIVTAEAVIATLAGVPEPSTITKWVAAALQALMILILGFFVLVELGQTLTWGWRWVQKAWNAQGHRERISEASLALCHMLLHMALMILALIGARARVRGLGTGAPGGGSAGAGGTGAASTAGGGSAVGGGGTVLRLGLQGASRQPALAGGPVAGTAPGITLHIPAAPNVVPATTGLVALGGAGPAVSVVAPDELPNVAMAVQGDRLAGNTRQLAIHLARLLRLPEVGGRPPGEDPDPGNDNDNHWWKEIKAFCRNVRQAIRRGSRKQAMRELRRRGFTDEQIAEIEARLLEAAERMGEELPGFLPPW